MFENMKEMRTKDILTHEEIAKVLNVDRSTYNGYEINKDFIPFKKLNDLANYHKVTIDYLVGLKAYQKREKEIQLDPQIVAENIKLLRKAKDLTQKEMAADLKLSQSSICHYEKGRLITTMNAIELAKKYNYSLDDLIQKTK